MLRIQRAGGLEDPAGGRYVRMEEVSWEGERYAKSVGDEGGES